MRSILSITAAALGVLAGAAGLTPSAFADATAAPAVAEEAASTGGGGCPVTWQTLKTNLVKVVQQDKGGLDNNMWAVVVTRTGVVCAVAFSGNGLSDQWLLSRQIAASKAFTANGLSLNGELFPTIALDKAVQPGGSLFGLAEANPLDTAVAYKGPTSAWGTASDPLVGKIAGGTVTFGGGVPLVKSGAVVGGLGLSGDTACTDDRIARSLRAALGLPGPDGAACKD